MVRHEHWIGPRARYVWLLLAPVAVQAADLRRQHLRTVQPSLDAGGGSPAAWQDMTCFMDLARFGLEATKDDVLFRSGHATADGNPEVLVVQDKSKVSKAPSRKLVFRSADGKCNEQAGTVCRASRDGRMQGDTAQANSFGMGAFAADAEMMSSSGAATTDKCSTMTCTADVEATLKEPGASYVRSMVGATALLSRAADTSRRFLSIGFGAGTMALVLQQTYPGSQQTVVELSPDVAAAAQCFGAGGIDVVTGDGREYMEAAADNAYDALFVDAFDASDKVPSCFTTSEFFHAAKRKLRKGGLLVMNAHTGLTLHNDVKDLLPAAQAAFGGGSRLQIGRAPGLGNAIVVAQAENDSESSKVALAQEDKSELSSWFEDALFSTPSQSTDGHVLTDADVQCHRH